MILEKLGYTQKDDQLNLLLEQQQTELEQKDRHIQHLSKNLRRLTRKYNQLEMSVSESIIEESESEPSDIEEIERLQTLLTQLNEENVELEKRLEEMQFLVDDLETKEQAAPSPINTNGEIEIEFSEQHEENAMAERLEENDQVETNKPIEPEFSPQFQMILRKHAEMSKVN